MDALPARDLTYLERALQAFNAGSDPTAGALQREFLGARVWVLSSTEVQADGSGLHLLALDGGDGETYLEVFTHEDRVDLEVGKRFPWMVNTTGENVLGLTSGGITINPGSDPSLAVAVKSAGVQEMREVAAARHAAAEARAARLPHELETALAEVDREAGMDAIGILRFGAVLWPATLVVPSARPLEGVIDVDACFTFGTDDDRLVAAFTDRDQLGDFASPHLLEITGGELVHRLPAGAGIIFNPQRPDSLPLTGEGLRIMATLIERQAPPA